MANPERSEHFGRICRTCMYKEGEKTVAIKRAGRWTEERQRQEQELKLIFDYPRGNEKVQIMELLALTTPQLLIQQTDELPKFICALCLEKLLAMHQFQQLCISSDQQMRNLLEYKAVGVKIEHTDETPATTVKDKQTDADPLCIDVQGFFKLELDDQDASILLTTAHLDEIEQKSVEAGSSDSMADGEDDNDSDWAMSQRKTKKPKKDKLIRSLKLATVQKDLTAVEEEPSGNENVADTRAATAKQTKNPNTDDNNKATSFKCDRCPRKYIKKESLKKHQIMHNKGLVKEYACEICDKKFIKSYSFKRHQRSHESTKEREGRRKRVIPRSYVCEYCNKGKAFAMAFQQSSKLKYHIRVHTGEQPFLCSECGKAFTTAGNMRQHLLRHTGLKRFECPECPKKFRCHSDLATHKAQVHTKIKPHVCDICDADFAKPFQLKKHKMYHNGEKPHKCEFCEMRFVCADHMRRHQRTHTGEKPYKCKYCERAFSQSNDLIKHLRLHLGDNIYKCELCPKAFRLVSELREHFAKHKKDDEATRQQNLKALVEEEARLRINLLGGPA